MAVLIIVVVALLTTVNYSITLVNVSRNKSMSILYAQEGLELAREQRALNWSDVSNPASWPTNPNGTLPATPFTRVVTVTDMGPNAKEIESVVTWEMSGKSYQTSLSTVLTNW